MLVCQAFPLLNNTCNVGIGCYMVDGMQASDRERAASGGRLQPQPLVPQEVQAVRQVRAAGPGRLPSLSISMTEHQFRRHVIQAMADCSQGFNVPTGRSGVKFEAVGRPSPSAYGIFAVIRVPHAVEASVA